jgi:biopolymer transport protein ExbD
MAAASEDEEGIISAINVTPLVDITLVLLIIMMVTAKIIVSSSLPLDLPKAAKGESIQVVFAIELTADGAISVDGKKLADDKAVMGPARAAVKKNKDLRAVIRADRTVQHGRIIRILDLLKQSGVAKIAFGVTPVTAEPGAVPDAPAPKEGAPKDGSAGDGAPKDG